MNFYKYNVFDSFEWAIEDTLRLVTRFILGVGVGIIFFMLLIGLCLLLLKVIPLISVVPVFFAGFVFNSVFTFKFIRYLYVRN